MANCNYKVNITDIQNKYKFKIFSAPRGEKGEKGEKGDTGEVSQKQLDNVQAQIDGLASGSPLVASSTSEMINTNKVYVNTTDGNWYYYDGDSWEIGGTYQSSGIADDSIVYSNLETKLQNSLSPLYNDNNVYSYTSEYISSDGTLHTSNNKTTFLWEIDVVKNETYYVYRRYDKNNLPLASYPTYIIKDSSNNILVKHFTTDEQIVNTTLTEIINIPAGATKLYINSTYGYTNTDTSKNRPKGYILKLQNYKPSIDVSYNNFDTNLKTMFKINYEEVAETSSIPNSIIQYDTPVNLANWTTKIYDVNPGENFKIEGLTNFGTYPLLSFGTKDVTLEYTFNNVTYNTPALIEKFNDASTISTFTIPDYCNKILVSVSNSNSNYKIYKQSGIQINPDNVDIDLSGLVSNPLNNKTLCFTGDSISAASTTGVKGFVQLMHENNPTANFYNYAHDGWTIGKIQNSSTSIQDTLPTILSEHPNSDYIILQGGANDIWQSSSIAKGDISNSYNANDFDRSTFAGGLEWMISYCITNFPAKKIGFIITHQIRWLDLEGEYMELARNICKKWSIPYIDLYNEANLNMRVPYQAEHYSITTNDAPNGDGCHPNLAGYQIITPKIENWLKYKI